MKIYIYIYKLNEIIDYALIMKKINRLDYDNKFRRREEQDEKNYNPIIIIMN